MTELMNKSQTGEAEQESEQLPEQKRLYERADNVNPGSLMPTWLPQAFAEGLIDETEIAWDLDDFRVAECHNRYKEEGLEMLLVAPDETRLFIGEDETARDSNGLFGYIIEPSGRLPLVRTTQEAIDILKPAQAAASEMDGATPIRHGEWFLVPTDEEPESKVFSGGVAERPFGGSPLENHVPTEYGLGITEDEFMERFSEICPGLDGFVTSPGEAFARVSQGNRLDSLEDFDLLTDLPTFEELRQFSDPIYVRGTIRHRDNDHYMESLGDQWHLAVTHDVDVFTIDTSDLEEETPTVRFD